MEKKTYYLTAVITMVFFLAVLTGLSHAQTAKELYPLAKKEGTVTMGSSIEEKQIKPILNTFEKKYPGVEVKYLRKSTGPLMSLVETEIMAGKISFDIILLSDVTDMMRLKEKNYFLKFKPETWSLIKDRYKDKDGYFLAHNQSCMLGAANTKSIAAADIPKSYKDCLKPMFKNKISNSSPSRGGSGLAAVVRVLDLYGWGFIEQLAKNGAMYVAGHGTVIRMCLSGERPLAWEASGYRVLDQEKKGAPIKALWFEEGVPTYGSWMGIPAKAPSPNAGKLLLNFLMSKEGQELAVKNVNRWSVLPGMKVVPAGSAPLDKANVWDPDVEYLYKNGQQIGEKFDKIFGLK